MPSKFIGLRFTETEYQTLKGLYKRFNLEGSSDYERLKKFLLTQAVGEKTEEGSQGSNSNVLLTPTPENASMESSSPLPSCPFMAQVKGAVECSKDYNSRDPKLRGKIHKLSLESCIQCDKRRQFMKQKSQQEREKSEDGEPEEVPQTPLQKIIAEDKDSIVKSPTELCPKTKKWIKVSEVCPDCDRMTRCPDFDRIWNDPELRRRIEWLMKNKK